ncbi:hypothetical protein GCM10011581_24760 [Saccharopolyspora subtropica]|uniref:Asp23/Gls24 family envelope stress response protein n=1 Tax=Saccharopolyspora thermophila TaxID=89367 RepID=A0A917NBU8_9PSEU|nr:Asp23/Gls24 family envelope stress response protein [Saccharopolyspora subtropica]GGI86727.1 hypothetical protein GCM10011581_24760 [Saccharopolyspora subtropica]
MAEQEARKAESQAERTGTNWTTTSGRGTAGSTGEIAETSQGRTTIGATVVQKIAVAATRQVPGVAALGGGMARAFGALRERIPGGSSSQTTGVVVEVGQKQAAIDLEIVVEYDVSIVELARAVRRNVITAVEGMTGLDVVEVNIAVSDIRVPGEEEEPAPARVE